MKTTKNPHLPQTDRDTLARPINGRLFGGVIAGLGQYFGIAPNLLRLVVVLGGGALTLLFAAIPFFLPILLVYLAAVLLIPSVVPAKFTETDSGLGEKTRKKKPSLRAKFRVFGLLLSATGFAILDSALNPMHGIWWPGMSGHGGFGLGSLRELTGAPFYAVADPMMAVAVDPILMFLLGVPVAAVGLIAVVLTRPRAAQTELAVLKRPGAIKVALGVAVGTLAVLAVINNFFWIGSDTILAILFGVSGATMLWLRTNGKPMSEPTGSTSKSRSGVRDFIRQSSVQSALGIGLVIAGAALFLQGQYHGFVALENALLPIGVVMTGLALVLSPFGLRLLSKLRAERAERIRAEERSNVAAHLHDSVLQTLALMQRHVDDPRKVASLARRQERELRQWLYGGPTTGSKTLASALDAVIADIEDLHSVEIESVIVGDTQLDERIEALVAATREALVNAAKFAGKDPIAVFTEVQSDGLRVFVRDKGPGFSLESVSEDRRGVRDSIVGRVRQHGGVVTINSSPQGTEIELALDINQTKPHGSDAVRPGAVA